MSHFSAHVHKSLQIFNGQVDRQKLCKELNAPKASWSHWFHQGKAFVSKTDSRSYAQVAASSNSNTFANVSSSNKGFEPSTCAVPAPIVKNTHVCPGGKYKINPTKSVVQVSANKPLGLTLKSPVASVALTNKFQILQDLHEDSITVLGDDESAHLVNNTVPDHVLSSGRTSIGFVDAMVANTGGSKNDFKKSIPNSSVENSTVGCHYKTYPPNKGTFLMKT